MPDYVVDNINHQADLIENHFHLQVTVMPSPGNALFGLLHVYKRALRARYLAAGIALPFSHTRVLHEIGRHKKGVTSSSLSALLLQDKALITRVCRELERKGLILRQPHPRDSRAFYLLPSEEGHALRARLTAIEARLETQMSAGLDERQLAFFNDTLRAMTTQLDPDQESP